MAAVQQGSPSPLAAEVQMLRALLPQDARPARPQAVDRKVQVLCRFRGQSDTELGRGGRHAWELGPSLVAGGGGLGQYTFDRVFGPEDSQAAVYGQLEPVVRDVLRGTNAAVLCYGQTSAGKTFTMEGSMSPGDDQGIIPRALSSLFELAGTDLSFRMSMLEIYNERLGDLLDAESEAEIRLVEDRARGCSIQGLVELPLHSCGQALELLQRGAANRATAVTGMNDASSRSHSIFMLKVMNRQGQCISKLSLVDLAGSECVKKAYIRGDNAEAANAAILEEAKSINTSLSALGLVISRLSESKRAGAMREQHVPFRSSKLTRALQDNLSGNSRTVLVINCSISSVQIAETLSTLRFGSRARSLVNSVTSGGALEESSRLVSTLRAARQEIERLTALSGTGCDLVKLEEHTTLHLEEHRGFRLASSRSVSPVKRRRAREASQALLAGQSPAMEVGSDGSISPLALSPRSRISLSQRASRYSLSALPSRRCSMGSQAPDSPSLLDLEDMGRFSPRSVASLVTRRTSIRSRRVSRVSVCESLLELGSPKSVASPSQRGGRPVASPSQRSRRPSFAPLALEVDAKEPAATPLTAETPEAEMQSFLGLPSSWPSCTAQVWDFPLSQQEKQRRLVLLEHAAAASADEEVEQNQHRVERRVVDLLQQYRQMEERYQAVLTENEWLSAERARAQEAAEASGERDAQVQGLQGRVAELEALSADASLESERRAALLAEEVRVAEAERDVTAAQLGEFKERLAYVQAQSLQQRERTSQELRTSEEARLSQLAQLTQLERRLPERIAAEAGAEAQRKRLEAELSMASERAAEAAVQQLWQLRAAQQAEAEEAEATEAVAESRQVEVEDLRRQVAEWTKKANDLQAESRSEQEKLEVAETAHASRSRLAEQERQLAAAAAEVARMRTEGEALKQLQAETKAQLQVEKDEVGARKEQELGDLRARVEELQSNRELHAQALAERNGECARLTEELRCTSKDSAACKEEAQSLKVCVAESEAKLIASECSTKELEGEAAALRTRLAELESKLWAAENADQQLEESKSAMHALKGRVAELERAVWASEAKCADLKQIELEADALRAQVTELRATEAAMAESRAVQKVEVEDLRRQVAEWTKKANDLQAESCSKQEKLEVAETARSATEDEHASSRSSLAEQEQQAAAAAAEVECMRTEGEALKQRVLQLESSSTSHASSLNSAQEAHRGAEAEAARLRRALDEAEAQANSRVAGVEANLSAALEECKDQESCSKERLAVLEAEASSAADLRQCVTGLQQQLSSSIEQLAALQANEASVAKLTDELAECRANLEHEHKAREQGEEASSAMQHELTKLRTQLHEVQRLSTETEKLREDLSSQLQSKETEAVAAARAEAMEAAALAAEAAALAAEETEQRSQSLQEELEAAKQERAELEEVRSKAADMERRVASLTDDISAVEAARLGGEEEIALLREQLTAQESRYAMCTMELQQLNQSYADRGEELFGGSLATPPASDLRPELQDSDDSAFMMLETTPELPGRLRARPEEAQAFALDLSDVQGEGCRHRARSSLAGRYEALGSVATHELSQEHSQSSIASPRCSSAGPARTRRSSLVDRYDALDSARGARTHAQTRAPQNSPMTDVNATPSRRRQNLTMGALLFAGGAALGAVASALTPQRAPTPGPGSAHRAPLLSRDAGAVLQPLPIRSLAFQED